MTHCDSTVLKQMDGVRGGDEEFPVALCRAPENSRLVIRGINEGGFSCVEIDFLDLLQWLKNERVITSYRASVVDK